NITPI
ncbi:Lipopolysaccharide export system permease protein LptF, partial [Haemophilus influenzae]